MNLRVHPPHTTKTPSDKPVLLVDMDGVIANYYLGFLILWLKLYPGRKVIPEADLPTFYIEDSYTEYSESEIRDITTAKGFFLSLPEMPYAAETLNHILDEGEFEVYICTSPDTDCDEQVCHSEKAKWIEAILGERWVKRLILTNDKTLIRGDFLIDDKPNITGVKAERDWIQVVFNQCYNSDDKMMEDKSNYQRLNSWAWSDWLQTKKRLQYLFGLKMEIEHYRNHALKAIDDKHSATFLNHDLPGQAFCN